MTLEMIHQLHDIHTMLDHFLQSVRKAKPKELQLAFSTTLPSSAAVGLLAVSDTAI